MAAGTEYVVERVVGKRIRRGKVQYQIKWKDCDERENTWEPAENLNCKDLLEQFAREEAEKRSSRGKRSSAESNENQQEQERTGEGVEKKAKRPSLPRASKVAGPADTPSAPVTKRTTKLRNGFEKGRIAEELLGMTEDGGELYFVVRWKGVDQLEMVPSKIIRQKEPDMVIDFYEKRIIWIPATKKIEE